MPLALAILHKTKIAPRGLETIRHQQRHPSLHKALVNTCCSAAPVTHLPRPIAACRTLQTLVRRRRVSMFCAICLKPCYKGLACLPVPIWAECVTMRRAAWFCNFKRVAEVLDVACPKVSELAHLSGRMAWLTGWTGRRQLAANISQFLSSETPHYRLHYKAERKRSINSLHMIAPLPNFIPPLPSCLGALWLPSAPPPDCDLPGFLRKFVRIWKRTQLFAMQRRMQQ